MAAGPPSEDFSFPPCFLQAAKTLVILTGLDTRNNAVHSAIWHLFNSGRAGEAVKPVTYKSVTADHIYPRDSPVVSIIILGNYLELRFRAYMVGGLNFSPINFKKFS